MTRAEWTWQLSGGSGSPIDQPLSPTFTSRFDAEAWLGEHWRRLADDSVATAQLLDGERPIGVLVPLRTA